MSGITRMSEEDLWLKERREQLKRRTAAFSFPRKEKANFNLSLVL